MSRTIRWGSGPGTVPEASEASKRCLFSLQDQFSLRLRIIFATVHILSFFISLYFYWRHNTYCEPYSILASTRHPWLAVPMHCTNVYQALLVPGTPGWLYPCTVHHVPGSPCTRHPWLAVPMHCTPCTRPSLYHTPGTRHPLYHIPRTRPSLYHNPGGPVTWSTTTLVCHCLLLNHLILAPPLLTD